ncbi:MAG: cell shape determination protein CcmA [Sedimenticola sp.]|jgi:cytoskeletal protein CcmA (bactofilin family)|nr:MAG: cell shape determination protein CcmA [Sedimenticola sp.]
MGRFKKFRQPKISTVIGAGTSITGDISFSGGLHVDGVICGNVVAEPDMISALTLSEKGVIEGDVRVPNIILNGSVIGDVFASSRVELAQRAKVTGTVYYKLLEMAMGAEVNGQLVHSEDIEPRRLSYSADEISATESDDEIEVEVDETLEGELDLDRSS